VSSIGKIAATEGRTLPLADNHLKKEVCLEAFLQEILAEGEFLDVT